MLKFFRRYTKIIIWFVVGSFVLWGGYSVTAMKKEGRFAGEVFGRSVSFQEYNRLSRATQLFMPSDKPVDNPELLRDYTWQNIIYAHEAKRLGIKVSDEEVRNEIASLLKQQGLISPTNEQYRIWLARSLQMSPHEFEEGLREFIRIQKLLRTQVPSPAPSAADKSKDPKAKDALLAKQKEAFIAWTNEVNKRADLKDYLGLPENSQEEPSASPAPTKTAEPKKQK